MKIQTIGAFRHLSWTLQSRFGDRTLRTPNFALAQNVKFLSTPSHYILDSFKVWCLYIISPKYECGKVVVSYITYLRTWLCLHVNRSRVWGPKIPNWEIRDDACRSICGFSSQVSSRGGTATIQATGYTIRAQDQDNVNHVLIFPGP